MATGSFIFVTWQKARNISKLIVLLLLSFEIEIIVVDDIMQEMLSMLIYCLLRSTILS